MRSANFAISAFMSNPAIIISLLSVVAVITAAAAVLLGLLPSPRFRANSRNKDRKTLNILAALNIRMPGPYFALIHPPYRASQTLSVVVHGRPGGERMSACRDL